MFSFTVKANVLRVTHPGHEYVWDPENKLGDLPHGSSKVCSYEESSDWDSESFFIFFVEDCLRPPLHLIKAPSFEGAYECFIDQEAERGHHVIKKEDNPEVWAELQEENGNPTCSFSSNGTPIDTESFQGFEVQFLSAERR